MKIASFFVLAGQFVALSFVAVAHPGSGIVVNDKGEVFFGSSGGPPGEAPGFICLAGRSEQMKSFVGTGGNKENGG